MVNVFSVKFSSYIRSLSYKVQVFGLLARGMPLCCVSNRTNWCLEALGERFAHEWAPDALVLQSSSAYFEENDFSSTFSPRAPYSSTTIFVTLGVFM